MSKKSLPAHKLNPPVVVDRVLAFTVYRIWCRRTRRSYVGITRKSAEARFREHVQFARNFKTNNKLAIAIRQYGVDAFSVEVLARTRSPKRVAELERKFIFDYQSDVRGYNTHPGGNLGGQTGKEVVYGGKSYSSISALCRAHGLDYRIFKKRRAKGYSFEDCVTGKPFMPGRSVAVEYAGIQYPSQKHLALAFGIHYTTFLGRMQRGLSLAECLV